MDPIPPRFYVQVRYCSNGAILSTELTLVSGDRTLMDALRSGSPGRTDLCAVYVDPGALHEPFQPIDRLLRVQDLQVTIAAAVQKWCCFKFLVDVDAAAAAPFADSSPESEPSPAPPDDRFYSVNELPVIDLSDTPRPPPPAEQPRIRSPKRESQHDERRRTVLPDSDAKVAAVPAPPRLAVSRTAPSSKSRLFTKAPAKESRIQTPMREGQHTDADAKRDDAKTAAVVVPAPPPRMAETSSKSRLFTTAPAKESRIQTPMREGQHTDADAKRDDANAAAVVVPAPPPRLAETSSKAGLFPKAPAKEARIQTPNREGQHTDTGVKRIDAKAATVAVPAPPPSLPVTETPSKARLFPKASAKEARIQTPKREGQHTDADAKRDEAKAAAAAIPAPPPRLPMPETPSKAKLFAKAPAHLVNKRRQSAERAKAAVTAAATAVSAAATATAVSLLSPATKVRRLSFDVVDPVKTPVKPIKAGAIVTEVAKEAKATISLVSSSSEASTPPPPPVDDVKPIVKPRPSPLPKMLSVASRTLRVMLARAPVAGSIYNSVVAASKDARSGDQIVVSSGIYREKSTVELRSNVTLRAANGVGVDDVVIVGRSVSFATLGVRGDNVAVRGITIRKNRSKSKSCYPAIIDTDPKIQNFLLIECRVDGTYDRVSPADKQATFQGVFFDIETTGRIENSRIENIPDDAIVANPDGMVHITNGAVRQVQYSAVRVAKRSFKKGQKPHGVCVFLNNVAIEDIDDVQFSADPGQISVNGIVNAPAGPA